MYIQINYLNLLIVYCNYYATHLDRVLTAVKIVAFQTPKERKFTFVP